MEELNKPDFLIVGVPKAGTTSLYCYLKEHPEVFLPEQKELHYFTYHELKKNISGSGDKLALKNVLKDKDTYLNLFKTKKVNQIAGDVSPSYFFYSEKSIPLIKEELGEDIKIIITLRNPITRAYSNYLHQKRLLHEDLSFTEALNIEQARKEKGFGDFWLYKEHSFYYKKCKTFLNDFGKNNVKLILFEDIKTKPLEVFKELCEFLNISSDFKPLNTGEVFNRGGVYKKNKMTEFLLKPSFFKELVRKLVGKDLGERYKEIKKRILSKNSEAKPEIDSETLIYLKNIFAKDVKNLKSLGVDVNKWKYFYDE